MKVGFLYGGQGSQVPKMGFDFYNNEKTAREFYDSLNTTKDIREMSFYSDEETLKITENTQPVLIAFQIMATKILEKTGIKPCALAGLSIGEYSALYAAGVLSEEDTLKIAEFRGQAMTEVSNNIKSAMFAVMGIKENELEEICKEASSYKKVFISNLNTKNQIVISGEEEAVKKAVDIVKNRGKRAVQLKVSGAFHTEYMKDVKKKLEIYFENINFNSPKCDIYLNLTGKIYRNENLKKIMADQVKSRVRFEDIIRNMINDGIDTFIEIGYGNVIKGFIKKIDRNVTVYSFSDYKSYMELKGVFNEEKSFSNRSN